MSKEDKKLQKQLVNEMMKVSKTNPDVMIYMQALMKCYEDLEKELDQYKNNWEELKEYLNNGINYWEEQEKEWIEQGFMKFGGEANTKIIYQGILNKMKELEENN